MWCLCLPDKFEILVCLQILELPGHPYYVGVQFHPEFKSRPGKPYAVFLGQYLMSLRFIIHRTCIWVSSPLNDFPCTSFEF